LVHAAFIVAARITTTQTIRFVITLSMQVGQRERHRA